MSKLKLHTNLGAIVIALDHDRAPLSCENVLSYAREGFYAGTIFHRVIGHFMIQGGGYDEAFNRKPTRDPIANEAKNGLRNERGTVAMARRNDPDSATAQFFINVVDNPFLDHKAESPEGFGYAVFGSVIEGMDVVDRIKDVPTGAKGPFVKDCPQETVTITQAEVVDN